MRRKILAIIKIDRLVFFEGSRALRNGHVDSDSNEGYAKKTVLTWAALCQNPLQRPTVHVQTPRCLADVPIT